MIFQYTWPQIVTQRKTATRRPIDPTEVAIRGKNNRIISVQHNGRTKWRVGCTYAIQPGRGQEQIGRIRLVRITRQNLQRISNLEARQEGFSCRREFLHTWERIHGPHSQNKSVWVLEFELVNLRPLIRGYMWAMTEAPNIEKTVELC
jgi:hypothetical protein